jgi:hypothetical protein
LAPLFPSFSSLPAALSIMLTLSPIVLDWNLPGYGYP